MAAEKTTAPAQHGQKGADQPAWYDVLINIFKKLLEYNMFAYGTKKKF
ncbi:hypothetical protein [Desulfocastanea catecholica]